MDDNSRERTLWVGNLGPDVTADLLTELFLQSGPLECPVKLVAGKDGKNGYAFVTFKHEESVLYACRCLGAAATRRQWQEILPTERLADRERADRAAREARSDHRRQHQRHRQLPQPPMPPPPPPSFPLSAAAAAAARISASISKLATFCCRRRRRSLRQLFTTSSTIISSIISTTSNISSISTITSSIIRISATIISTALSDQPATADSTATMAEISRPDFKQY
uniref:RRM domain-containing protein n=1 Tax=Macrostomum lignano TaxID=282301 RepID=A0A1I8FNI1_9PLAT